MTPGAPAPHAPRGDDDRPTFSEPWEAQAFALAVALRERGVLTAPEWAHLLGAQIAAAQAGGDPDVGDTYYRHWLAALEQVTAGRCGTSPDEQRRYERAWGRAMRRCPHGQPVELLPCDFEPRED